MPKPDEFNGTSRGFESPALNAFDISPNNDVDLAEFCRAIYIGVGGTGKDLKVTLWEDTVAVTFKDVPQGQVLPIAAKRVHATGTTAQNLIGLY